MLTMLKESKPDPKDPTLVVKEYMEPWWTQAGEKNEHKLFDIDEAFTFHFDKVSWSHSSWFSALKAILVWADSFTKE